MKTTSLLLSFIILLGLGISSCKEDETPTLGDPPSASDAAFTFKASADNPNVIEFTTNNPTISAKWDFGNGTTGEGNTITSSYPNAGTYTVTLTVFNSGGNAASSQDVVIDNDDPTLLNNPLYTLLTGGIDGKGFKTWVMDSTRAAHFGVGPNPIGGAGYWPEWWQAARLEKSGTGMYDDEYVFKIGGFKFDHITHGEVYINNAQTANFPDAYENKGDYTAPFEDQLGESWTIVEGEVDTTLTVSGSSFLGYYAGTRTYKIIRLTENELFLHYVDAEEPTRAWYIRLVPDDYPVDNGGGGNDPTYELPIDFEGEDPEFTVFGNSTYEIIANPNSGGINTSGKVLQTVHGNETWAGLYVNLTNKLDLTGADSTIAVKVFAPTTGTMRIKLENSENTNENVEKDVVVDKANEWIEVSVGFSTAASDKFDRVVLFPGWDVSNAGTFLIDDISQK